RTPAGVDATDSAARSGGRGWHPLLMASIASQCTNQFMFGVLSRLPGGRIGESHYEPEFPVESAPVSVDAMSMGLGDGVDRQLNARERVAAAWRSALEGVNGLTPISPSDGTRAAFLRFPVLVSEARRREEIAGRLAAARFHYVGSYPGTLNSIAGF